MKKTVLNIACALTVIALIASGCNFFKKDPKRPVATVNDRIITLKDFQDALKRLAPNAGSDPEGASGLKKELLNQLVEEELIIQEAEKAGLSISIQEVDFEIESVQREYGEEDITASVIERYGGMDAWKEEIKRKLLVKKAVLSLVNSSAPATEAEAREYYEAHSEDFKVPLKVRARMIVVATEEDAVKLRKRLTRWNFASVAKEASLSPEAKEGGDLGFFSPGDMPPKFESAVMGLKPGEISPVVNTEYGYHIFLVEEKAEAGTLQFLEVRGRIMEGINSKRAEQGVIEWVQALKRQARIEIKEGLL
jgi:peptidyl-prolyl cis-trans isomerase C